MCEILGLIPSTRKKKKKQRKKERREGRERGRRLSAISGICNKKKNTFFLNYIRLLEKLSQITKFKN
jgi:hypothetical protein